MKKLLKLYEEIQGSDVDDSANASANTLLFMDKLKNTSAFNQMSNALYLPSDKYKAILKFASLLGIPEERFGDFVTQQQNQNNA